MEASYANCTNNDGITGNVFFRFQGYFNAFLICVGGAVMSLRVVAMHEASKKILALVCALLIGELISMVTVLSFSFRTITGLSAFHSYSYGWIFSICSPTAVSSTRLHQDGRPALLLDFLPLSYGS